MASAASLAAKGEGVTLAAPATRLEVYSASGDRPHSVSRRFATTLIPEKRPSPTKGEGGVAFPRSSVARAELIMPAADDLDLSTLPDDELVAQMHDDLYDGLMAEIEEAVRILLERGWTPYDVLTKALVEGMRIVGIDFRDGILFVPEVLLAANAMKAGMAILRPLLAETGAPKIGKMVIGTVKGDIHDIGKNLVCMMMEGAGFEVIDLGINNSVEKYLAAIEEHQPDIVGMSALLTTTMPYMKVVIDTLKEKGIRNDYIVLVGGAPVNESFAEVGRRRRLLPRRRDRGRDRQVASRQAAGLGRRQRGAGVRRSATGPDCCVIACGALAREIRAVIEPNGCPAYRLTCLPAKLHNRPQLIPEAVRRKIRARRGRSAHDLLRLWRLRHRAASSTACSRRKASSALPGAHCYAFYAGLEAFDALHEEEPGTFYLTDFLARHFERLIDRGPRPRSAPGTLRRLFPPLSPPRLPAPGPSPALVEHARAASAFLKLPLEIRETGFGLLEPRDHAIGRPDGRAHRRLLARHTGPGHRPRRPPDRQGGAAQALHGSDRRRRHAGERHRRRRVSRGVAARRTPLRARTISMPRSRKPSPRWTAPMAATVSKSWSRAAEGIRSGHESPALQAVLRVAALLALLQPAGAKTAHPAPVSHRSAEGRRIHRPDRARKRLRRRPRARRLCPGGGERPGRRAASGVRPARPAAGADVRRMAAGH